MAKNFDKELNDFMAKVIAKNPGETEFHQAVHEVVHSILPFLDENPKYKAAKVLERMVEPERVFIFRVPSLPRRCHASAGQRTGHRVPLSGL